MEQLYVAKIKFINFNTEEKTDYAIIPAKSFSDAVAVIEKEWGPHVIINLEIDLIADDEETSAVIISKSIAKALINGLYYQED